MATIQGLKTQIQNANALGRQNLAEKGVTVEETATTYDIMSKISEISGGDGVTYTSIVYNTDNTVTLTDTDGIVHTMSCTYEDGKLIGAIYDGEQIELTYNGDALVKVGKTVIDMGNVPATSGTTFNIAYGETAPEDTSKLWIKANEPANVSVGSDIDGIESIKIIGNLPTTYSAFGSAIVGTKIYLIGGKDQNNNKLNTINVFDTETETITTLDTTLPNGHSDMGCVSVGSKIYLFSGIIDGGSYTTGIKIFDTETNTIRISSATFPSRYSYMSCVAKGNKIYLFGGYYYDGLSYYKNTISVFDTDTETLSILPITLPIACHGMGSAIVGTKIYLIGGMSKNGILNTINVFDTETETISTLTTTLPKSNSSMGCASIGTKIYLFGGGSTNTINVFDTETETITTLDTTLPIASSSMGTVTNGNKIYLFGGTNDESRIKVFTLTHELANGDIELQSGLLKNKFNLINTDTAQVKIGVENVYIGNANNEAELCEAYLHNGTEWVVI